MKRTALLFLLCSLWLNNTVTKQEQPKIAFAPQVQSAEQLLQATQQKKRIVKVVKKKVVPQKPAPKVELVKAPQPNERSFFSKFLSPTPRAEKIARHQQERGVRRARSKKQSTARTLRQKKMTKMTEEELETLLAQFEKSDRLDLVIKCLDQLILTSEDKHKLERYMLKLADLLRERNYLEKAGKLYKQFANLYPGSKRIEYVEYQSISCHYAETLTYDRDQSMTEETIKLADKFLDRGIYTTHNKEVQEIKNKCYEKLFDHEVGVFEFYANMGRIGAAQGRLREMRDRFLPLMPTVKPRLVAFELNLQGQASANNVMIATTIDIDDVVVQEIKPATQVVAQNTPEKERMKNKF